MQRLHVREAYEVMRVEGHGRSGDDSGRPAARIAVHEQRKRKARQREPRKQQQVERHHRRHAQPHGGNGERALQDQRF
ncbi:hypothetical protein D3C83_153900 [compost metagenome]